MQAAARDHTYVQGTIVRIDPENYEGLVRIETPKNPDKLIDVRFERSSIQMDERYVGVLLAGLHVTCAVKADVNNELKVIEIFPHDNMVYVGVVSDVRRRDGLAEVTVEDLDTTIVFCRTHLDAQDEFQKVRTGVRVRIEIGFNNFISKQKPPRPTRVVLLSDPNDPEHAELRPALRRSSSFSKDGSRRCEADGEFFRPRSQSQGRRFCDEPLSVPPPWNSYEAFHPNHTLPLWSRPNSPMNPPPPFYQMPPCTQYPMMPQAAGWRPPLAYFGLPPGSRGPRPPPGVFQPPFAEMLQPSPKMPPFQRLHSHASRHPHPLVHPQNPNPVSESNSRPDFRSYPDSDMPHGDGLPELPPEAMDESQVLLEITVDELRRLMLERPPTPHLPQP